MKPRPWVLLAWLSVLAACVTAAWLFGLPELAALAIAGATSLVASAMLLRFARPPLVTASMEPSTCNRGDAATLLLNFEAPAARASSAARLWGRLGTAGDGIVAVAHLQAGRSTSVKVQIPTPVRGIVRVGNLWLRCEDPLHLFHEDHRLDCTAELLVRPEVHQLGGEATVGGRRPAPGRRVGSGTPVNESDSELVGLRPYVRGDDVRRIHWRTSARLREPHVVQVEPPVHSPGTTVALDQGTDSDSEGFERAVSAAASVLVAAAGAGRSPRLVTLGTHGTLHDSGRVAPASVGDLLDTLATVSRLPGIPPIGSVQGSEEDTVVWCTATDAAALQVPSGVDVVITCDDDAAQRDTLPGVHDSVGHVAFGPSVSLAAAWQAAMGEPERVP